MRAAAYRTMSSVASMVSVLAIAATLPPVPLFAQNGGPCIPVRERPGRKFGCFITARTDLGHLSQRQRLYWHPLLRQIRGDVDCSSRLPNSALRHTSHVPITRGRTAAIVFGAAAAGL